MIIEIKPKISNNQNPIKIYLSRNRETLLKKILIQREKVRILMVCKEGAKTQVKIRIGFNRT